MPQLQRALDREWHAFRSSLEGTQALRRWSAEDRRYGGFTTAGDLRDHVERCTDADERDALMADLLRRSPHDGDARHVLLAALRPGLVRLTRRASAFWDHDEAESAVITAAIERLANPDAALPLRPAAGVLSSVWTIVWDRRRRERREEDHWGARSDPEVLDAVPASPQGSAIARVVEVVSDAVRQGAVPAKGARLVLLHWVHGYSNTELAELDGVRPCTIRKHRRHAERRLADFAA